MNRSVALTVAARSAMEGEKRPLLMMQVGRYVDRCCWAFCYILCILGLGACFLHQGGCRRGVGVGVSHVLFKRNREHMPARHLAWGHSGVSQR